MRYRKLSSSGDYTFGHSQADFLVNSPACVAQAVKTRLGLRTGEWFLDLTDGTPYMESILGKNTQDSADNAIKLRILGTQGVGAGVLSIDAYASQLVNRALSVQAICTSSLPPPALLDSTFILDESVLL